MRIEDVLIKPMITEKTMQHAQRGVYTFQVNPQASKHTIAKVVADQFDVTVESVSTSKMAGKVRRYGTKRMPKLHLQQKKAMVKVAQGQSIHLFDISEEKDTKK